MTDNNTQKAAERSAAEILDRLNKYNFQTTDLAIKQYNLEFEVRSANEKIKILIYFGKKGLKTVVQGNKNSPLFKEIEEITIGNISLGLPEFKIEEPDEYIGSDETGKGDVFGPLVTCAYFVNKQSADKLRALGVRDSKDLGENQIFMIASGIKKLGKDNYEIISINPQRYNELYEKFKNINELLNWSHSKAIENLLQQKNTKTIITDKFRKKDLRFSTNFNYGNYNIIQETKAEKYIAVAAASILARSKQLEWFAVQKKNGFDLKRGASEEVKLLVKNLIKNDRNSIKDFAKLHFKTVANFL